MRNTQWWHRMAMVGLMVGMSGLVAVAAEEAAKTAPADPAASSSSSQASAAPAKAAEAPAAKAAAPVTPAPAVPDLKPIVIKFSGEVVQVNRQDAEHPGLTVRDRYGVTKEMTAEAKAVESVKTGDQITVEYTYDVATGKRQVQTVTVTQAATQAPAAAQ